MKNMISPGRIAGLFCFIVTFAIFNSFPAAGQGSDVAWIENLNGTILVKESGSVMWRDAVDGERLAGGTVLKSRGNSSAIIHFTGGGYFKLMPVSEVEIESVLEKSGSESPVITLEKGRVWLEAEPSETERVIVEAAGSIMDTTEGSLFVETGISGRIACIDVVDGTLNIRSRITPEDVSSLGEDRRIFIEQGQAPGDSIFMQEQASAADETHSCMSAPPVEKIQEIEFAREEASDYVIVLRAEAKVKFYVEESGGVQILGQIQETGFTQDQYIIVTGNTTVTFTSGEYEGAELSFAVAGCSVNGATCMIGDECCSGNCADGTCAPTAEKEYEVLVITTSGQLIFTCETAPQIKDVKVAGQPIADGDTATLTPSECNTTETIDIEFSATPICGTLSTVKMTAGESTATLNTVAEGETGEFKPSIALDHEQQATIKFLLSDSFNNETTYTFTVKLERNTNIDLAPSISSVSFDGSPVSTGESVSLTIDSCDSVSRTIAGSAETTCGDISEVVVTKNSNDLTVSGTSDWNVTDDETSSEETDSYKVTVTNSYEKQSEPFEFSVQKTMDIPPATLEIETIGTVAVEDYFTPLTMYKDNLEGDVLRVSGAVESGGCGLEKVEGSVDDGATWFDAEGTDAWSFSFAPDEQTYYITARAVDTAGNASPMGNSVEVTYEYMTVEDNLLDIFERLIQAYIDRDTSTFTDLTSSSYTSDYSGIEDINSLETSLDNKFTANTEIYLRYSVATTIVSGDTGQVGFSWGEDSNDATYPNYAVFQFILEEQEWRFYTVEDDNTFLRYVSVVQDVDLTSLDTDLTADESDSTTIQAEVWDRAGSYVEDGTEVYFYTNLGSVTSMVTTVNGIAEATFTVGAYTGTASIYAKSGEITSNTVQVELHSESAPLPPTE